MNLVPSKGSTPEGISTSQRFFERDTRLIRRLIWLYLILWVIEGGLRRWVLPDLATPLLLVRDPLVIAIYVISFRQGVFPFNSFFYVGAVLAVVTFLNGFPLGHGNFFVAAYGVRCDFLHVPLIFIMGKVLRFEDVVAMAKVAVAICVPYTLLLVLQFYSPQEAWVNRGVGGSLEGAGFDGALGRYRPPGTFSFITGPASLYPMFAACWFSLLLLKKLPMWLAIPSALAIALAVPLSISRTLMIQVLVVIATGALALVVSRRLTFLMIFQIFVGCIVLAITLTQIPAFLDGLDAFVERWKMASDIEGNLGATLATRVLVDIVGGFNYLDQALTGRGTGYSTNVGQMLLSGAVGFGESEAEWGRLVYDNGLILGLALTAYRFWIAFAIVFSSIRALRAGNAPAILIAIVGFLLIARGQWAQPTNLGAGIIIGGIALAFAYRRDAYGIPAVRKGTRRHSNATNNRSLPEKTPQGSADPSLT